MAETLSEVPITFKATPELKAALRRKAREEGRNLSAQIRFELEKAVRE